MHLRLAFLCLEENFALYHLACVMGGLLARMFLCVGLGIFSEHGAEALGLPFEALSLRSQAE